MVLKPKREKKQAEALFRQWGLDFAVVGLHHDRANDSGGTTAGRRDGDELPIKGLATQRRVLTGADVAVARCFR